MSQRTGADSGVAADDGAAGGGTGGEGFAPIAEEGELFRTHIGGSAVVEGVMMRGKRGWAVAVREEAGGMYVEEHGLPPADERPRWQRLPLVRGCVSFAESMVLSYRALAVSAEHAYPEEAPTPGNGGAADSAACGQAAVPSEDTTPSVRTEPAVAPGRPGGASSETCAQPSDGMPVSMIASIALGLALGVALFVALPVAVANLLVGDLQSGNALVWNLVEALLRIAVLIAYVGLCGLVPDMARTFAYHGAEHQAIHCFEHGLPLTPENCARFSRFHVRCGTAFLVMTVAVAILVNTLAPVGSLADALGLSGALRAAFVFCSRLVLLPLVAGLSYELTVKWAGSHPDSPLVRVVLWPGLQMQRLTTRTPDAAMLECAIAALERVRAQEDAA